jgi:transcriptional regulator with XRE-family HTH domain
LRALIDEHFQGNAAAFACAVDRNKSVISTWLSRSASPQWSALCEVAFVFGVTLRDLLEFNEEQLRAPKKLRDLGESPRGARQPRRKAAVAEDFVRIERRLREVEQGLHAQVATIAEVEKLVRTDRKTLRRRFPKLMPRLCRLLSARRELRLHRQRCERQRRFQSAAVAIGEELRGRATLLTRREFDRRLAEIVGVSPHFSDRPDLLRLAMQVARSAP